MDEIVDNAGMNKFLTECGLKIFHVDGSEMFSPPAKKRLYSQTKASLQVCTLYILYFFYYLNFYFVLTGPIN